MKDLTTQQEHITLLCFWQHVRVGLGLPDSTATPPDIQSLKRELLLLLCGISHSQRESIIYDAHDRVSRLLANWWEQQLSVARKILDDCWALDWVGLLQYL